MLLFLLICYVIIRTPVKGHISNILRVLRMCDMTEKQTCTFTNKKLLYCYYKVPLIAPLLMVYAVFFKENVRYPPWSYRDPISLILGTRFSRILGT